MPAASWIVPRIYLVLPIVAGCIAVLRTRRSGRIGPVRRFISTCSAGAICGMAVVLLDLRNGHGEIPLGQLLIGSYWGVCVACVVAALGAAVGWGTSRLVPCDAEGQPRSDVAQLGVSLLRAVLLVAIIVPYLSAMLLIYRPRIVHSQTPMSELGVSYQDVAFSATDGLHLRGWWIPAARTGETDDANPAAAWGEGTVILCHGFNADKASQLQLVRDLVPNGYNVLAFDFRAHGESDGQFTTFGDLERRDVLGAVRWLRERHPGQAQKIYGLGETLGAAALTAAAADLTDGQYIDAVAVFAPYDRLSDLIQDVADRHFVPVAGWFATHVALPIAGAQLGTRLEDFAPAASVEQLAPRPLLVMASEHDKSMDISRSRSFYERASQPKYCYWIIKGGRRAMLFENARAASAVRAFFETARQIL